ncbi:YraN family protein [Desulfobacterales bacterium HSG16]|nr:YraN family protein [Desulfobacterales bacterium HSG16]
MFNKNQRFGIQGESLAVRYLKSAGYHIIQTNYRTKIGEIDVIAKDADTIVFVEVKARSSARFGSPKHAVTHRKMRTISKVALYYLKITKQTRVRARFDVVSINTAGKMPEIELVKNAFPLSYG